MTDAKCERCLYAGECLYHYGKGCQDFVDEESMTERLRDEYRSSFGQYLDSFENC